MCTVIAEIPANLLENVLCPMVVQFEQFPFSPSNRKQEWAPGPQWPFSCLFSEMIILQMKAAYENMRDWVVELEEERDAEIEQERREVAMEQEGREVEVPHL